ncbi:PotD/PotF family extracellular solute-binding protein [Haloplanus salilacus]|uniref:ABC transporter substrate-binding protein n=1 Tax=Haloplanus salilacus TaxID=2949994 RepID=UPI0030D05EAA
MREHLKRRQYLKGIAVGASSAALAGCTGGGGGGGSGGNGVQMDWEAEEMATVQGKPHPELLEPTDEELELSTTVSHLTWAGYDGENVQGPFRDQFDTDTSLDLFTEDPQAINRLSSGEWSQFDIFTPNNAFIANAVDEDLLRPIDEEAWRPYTFDNYLDLFKPENGYKYAHVNEDGEFDTDGQLYALPQRWGWVSMCVNQDTVAESDWQTYDIAWDDEYNVGLSDWFFWMIQIIMLREGIDPYKEHSDEEREQVRQATFDLFDNAEAIYPDVASQNQALSSGEIDILIMSSNFGQGTLRRDGRMEFKNVIPDEEGGIIWVEQDSFLKGELSPLADNYVAYLQSPEAAYNLSWPEGASSVNVVPHASSFDQYSDEQKAVLRTEDLDDILANSVFFDVVPDLESFQPIWREAKARM